ncbi:MAG: transcriptional repressor LexA [Oscillospiraceae bacterium]|nr:transcriptional repressor LexA [Oscillospiraceae bacterium]
MATLSNRQQLIYDYIIDFSAAHGFPPSVREIGAQVGLKSPSTVHFHLKALVEMGIIKKIDGKTRTITISSGTQGQAAADRRNLIPVLGNVAAGSPILAEESIETYLPFDTNGLSGEHFALRVRGESMLQAAILPGDLVIVHQQETANNGEIVVALLEDEATVKTLHRINGTTWLMPENDDYKPIDGTHAQLLGKVVGVMRFY